MMIELIDIQAGFGGSAVRVRHPVSAEDIARHLRRHRIAKAVVRITPETQDFDIGRSNKRLYEAVSAYPEFVACPAVCPASSGDLPAEAAQVADAIQQGAMAAVIRPGPDCWQVARWSAEPLMQALRERRLPLLCLERLVPLTTVALLAEIAPEVPLAVAEVSYRNHRTLIPLMQTYANVFLSIGNAFTAHVGVEWYADLLGPERLLFGTGLPESEPGGAIAQLLYADLPEDAIALIGSGNARRLQEGIRR